MLEPPFDLFPDTCNLFANSLLERSITIRLGEICAVRRGSVHHNVVLGLLCLHGAVVGIPHSGHLRPLLDDHWQRHWVLI